MNLVGKALNKQIWCVTDSDAPWNWLLIKDQGEEDKASDPIRKSAWVVFCFNARFILSFIAVYYPTIIHIHLRPRPA